jgi:peroxiredoxin
MFLMVACAALSVLVVLLAMQNLKLKKQIAAGGGHAAEEAVKPGESFGNLTLKDAAGSGRPLEFGQGEERTLLLVFSVHCPACEQTFPVWDDLVRGLGSPPGLRIVGVQTDRPDPDADPGSTVTASFPYDVFGLDYEHSDAMKHIPYIPATVVLDTKGVVEKVWFGLLTEDSVEEVREAVGAVAG